MKRLQRFILVFFLLLSGFTVVHSQMVTGVWKGRINRQKVEVKIISHGDSLTGTSYYYESANHYRRYSIKGYFDPNTNSAVWWDDQLIEEKTGRFNLSSPGKNALLSRADFNCPGDGRMMLDGNASLKDDDSRSMGDVHLDKITEPLFADEWDFVIDNFLVGANDPDIIDSIASLQRPVIPETTEAEPQHVTIEMRKINEPVKEKDPVITTPEPSRPLTIEEKFTTRKKVLTKEIPVSGDSIELRFYDYAQIDGDSISLFLNDKLIFQHIRLAGTAYIIKLAVSQLNKTNELIMVAENLGTIPPNTSYMVAIVDGKRHEARLESTEGSSAMIRLKKM